MSIGKLDALIYVAQAEFGKSDEIKTANTITNVGQKSLKREAQRDLVNSNNKKHCVKYSSGSIAEFTINSSGFPEGDVFYQRHDGSIRLFNLKNNVKDGSSMCFHANGDVETLTYKNGRQEGPTSYRTKRSITLAYLVNGRFEGVMKKTSFIDGSVKEGIFKNGVYVGPKHSIKK